MPLVLLPFAQRDPDNVVSFNLDLGGGRSVRDHVKLVPHGPSRLSPPQFWRHNLFLLSIYSSGTTINFVLREAIIREKKDFL